MGLNLKEECEERKRKAAIEKEQEDKEREQREKERQEREKEREKERLEREKEREKQIMDRRKRDMEDRDRQLERDRERAPRDRDGDRAGRDRDRDRDRERDRGHHSRERDFRYSRDRSRDRSPRRYSRSPRRFSRERSFDRGRRSRSVSPSNNRRFIGNHTSSTDPELVKARLFIGNLEPEKVTRDDLINMFLPYGKLLGVSLVNSFGFVQYTKEEDARRAIEAENGNLFKGSQLDIRLASEGKGRRVQREELDRERSPPPRRSPMREPYRDDPYGRPLPPLRDDPYRRGVLPPPRDPYYERYRRDLYRDVYPPPPPLPPPAPAITDRPPFECQILMLGPELRDYAEMVDRKLRSSAFLCDLAIVTEEAQITKAVEDTVRRTVPYAIILRPQNEAHRSITLNILHGVPQEHRNMPVDDALALVLRDFETYLDELQKKKRAGAADSEFVRPDQHTHYLLNLLADNRILTLEELNTVIGYLEERRRRLTRDNAPAQNAVSGPVEKPTIQQEESAINQQQQHLQNKILNMLNGGDGATQPPIDRNLPVTYPHLPIPTPQPVPPPSPREGGKTTVAGINLDNPSVQHALDNLLHNTPSLLRNITAISGPGTASNGSSPLMAGQQMGGFMGGQVRPQQQMGGGMPQGERMGGPGPQAFGGAQQRMPWSM